MTIARKSAVFLALAFGLSGGALGYGAVKAAWFGGTSGIDYIVFALVPEAPTVAALVCVLLFERGRRLEALGLRFRPNLWWLAAFLVPLTLWLIAAVANLLIDGQDFFAGTSWQAALQRIGEKGMQARFGNVFLAVAASIVAALVTEELGWRGYLYDLWRGFGFWRFSFSVGLLWAIWHWPMIWIFGLGFPEQRLLGLVMLTIACVLMSPYITLIRDRSGSVITAGIFHGMWNSVSNFGNFYAYCAAYGAMALGLVAIAWWPRRGKGDGAATH